MIVYKMSDRIPVEIGDVKFWVSPLSYGQKMELASCSTMVSGEQKIDGPRFATLLIKFSVKEVEGITNFDGTPYELQFDKDGTLSQECLDEILQIEQSPGLLKAATHLFTSMTDYELDGVKIDMKAVKNVSKKNSA